VESSLVRSIVLISQFLKRLPFYAKGHVHALVVLFAGAAGRCLLEGGVPALPERVGVARNQAKTNIILILARIFNNLVSALYHHSRFLCIVVSW
jgi:hypothetical protein